MGFQGVFFDVDGTLIGVRPEPEVLYQQVCQEFGVDCAGLAGARAVALRFFYQHGLEYLDDEAGMWRQANRQAFLHLGAGERAGACADRFQLLFRQHTAQFAYPDVVPALEGLRARGYLLGALTGRLYSSEGVLTELGLRRYFTFYLYAGELAVYKPDPRLYHTALERAGLPAAAVVLVGDDSTDAAGARSVGMAPILIDRGQPAPPGEVPRIADLRELLPWLDAAA